MEESEIIRLIRWSILQSKVRGSMFDRLAEVAEKMKTDEPLCLEDERALELIREIAKQEGFDPTKDLL